MGHFPKNHPMDLIETTYVPMVFNAYALDQSKPLEVIPQIEEHVKSLHGKQLSIEEQVAITAFGLYMGNYMINLLPGSKWVAGQSNQDTYVKVYLTHDIVEGRAFFGFNPFMYLNALYMDFTDKLEEMDGFVDFICQYGSKIKEFVQDDFIVTPDGKKFPLTKTK